MSEHTPASRSTSGYAKKIESLINQRDSLRAVNAELMEALKSSRAILCIAFKAVAPDLFNSDEAVSEHLQIRRIDAAIDAAMKGES